MQHAQLFLGSRRHPWTLDISFDKGEKFKRMELLSVAINAIVIDVAQRRGISEQVICENPQAMSSIRTHAAIRVEGFVQRYPYLMEKGES